jgi:acyl-CoA synthetase (AMP-forming)/AMP-acid ligase II
MFSAHIAYHALRRPQAVAMVLPKFDVTYEKLESDINAVAHKLKGILPGGPALIIVSDLYLHYLLVLALARLNIVSASLDPQRQNILIPLLKPQAILSDRAVTAAHGALEVRVSSDWLRDAVASGVRSPVVVPIHPDDPARLVTSSGTTGLPKKILLTHRMMIRRFKNGAIGRGTHTDTRLLMLVGIDTAWGLGAALRCWWSGGAVCVLKPNAEQLVGRRVTTLAASPRQLQNLLERLPADFEPIEDLAVTVGGSKAPRAVSLAARLRLASSLTFAYGSAEAASVALCPAPLQDSDPDVAGHILPWVEVQAVDEAGRVLPPGEVGELRIRSEEVVDGYLDDPEATAKSFRDGWFHPGDLGAVTPRGLLKVVGRADDLLNIGGIKISPEKVESAVTALTGVADAAVFTTSDRQGLDELWVAIVEDGPTDRAAIVRTVAEQIPGLRLRAKVVTMPAIPRTPMGKVERYKVRESVAKARPVQAAEQS